MKNTRSENDYQRPAYVFAYPSKGTFKTLFGRLDTEVITEEESTDIIKYKNPKIIELVALGQDFGKMNINENGNRTEDYRPDGKRLRFDIPDHKEDVSTKTSPICHKAPSDDIFSPAFIVDGIASPGLANIKSFDLPEDVHIHLCAIANYLSPERQELLASWLSENSLGKMAQFEENTLQDPSVNGPTDWKMSEAELFEGLQQSSNETIAAGDLDLTDLEDILETIATNVENN